MKRRIIAMIMIFAMAAMGMTGCSKAPAKANEPETRTEAVTKENSTKAEKETVTAEIETKKTTTAETEVADTVTETEKVTDSVTEAEPVKEAQVTPAQTEAPKQENTNQSQGTANNTPAEPVQVQTETPKTETSVPASTEADNTSEDDDLESLWDELCYDPLPPVSPDSLEYRINNGTAGLDELRQFILEGFNYTMLNAKTNQHEVFLDDRYNASAQWYAEYLERTYYDLSKCGPSCHSGGQLRQMGIEVALHEGIFQTDTTMGAMKAHARYMPTHMLVEGSKLEKIGIGIVYVDRIPGYICVIQSYDSDIVDGQVTEYTIPDLPDINTVPVLHKEK